MGARNFLSKIAISTIVGSVKFSPMDVLAANGLEEASTICFDKLAHVKNHIRVVHGFNPSVMEGNDLFHRFRVSCPYYSLVHSLTF